MTGTRRGGETVITTRRGTYRVGAVFRRGASAVLYETGTDTCSSSRTATRTTTS